MKSQGLTFIHLSDIHFNKNSGDSYDLDSDLRHEILEDIGREKNTVGCVSGVLISGDIAFSGKKSEYKKAKVFLTDLCCLLEIPETSIYCVPGNHDVDQKITKESHSLDRAQIAIETASDLDSEISGFLRDFNSKSMMYSHIHEYNNFSAQFNCNIDATDPMWKNDLKLNDESILRLYGLNTVIISSYRDKWDRQMILGKYQLPQNEFGVTYIGLGHHPPEVWKDSDETKTTLLNRIHIQLYGHKHSQNIVKQNNSLILFSGATHPFRSEKKWRPRYNWLSVYVDRVAGKRSLITKVYPRVLDESDNCFIADSNSCKGNNFIEYSLNLDRWDAPKTASWDVEKVPEVDKIENMDDQTGDIIIANPIRTLVYRFFGLSYTTRSSILNGLALLHDKDDGVEHTKLFRILLKRAEEKAVLPQLWGEIEKAHGDCKYTANPFKDNISQAGD